MMGNRASANLYGIQILGLLIAAVAFASFPRRPDIYHREQVVDQQKAVSLLSLLSFSWNLNIFNAAKERQLETADLPRLEFITRSENIQQDFTEHKKPGRFWQQLLRFNARNLVHQWALAFLIAILSIFPQIVLYNFLSKIERGTQSSPKDPLLLVWALALFFTQALQVGATNWLKWITESRMDIPLESLVQTLVFAKALKQYDTVSSGQDSNGSSKPNGQNGNVNGNYQPDTLLKAKEKKDEEKGQSAYNLLKVDSSRVTNFCQCNSDLPMAAFKLALASAFLIRLMGWLPVLSGLTAASLAIPLNLHLSRKQRDQNSGLMQIRDFKAHLLAEALLGMRQIRYSALEDFWEDKILASRDDELKQYWRVALGKCLIFFTVNIAPLLLAGVTFTVYVWKQRFHIKASVIFTALGLFDQLDDAVSLLRKVQINLLEAWASVSRLDKYFGRQDKQEVTKPGSLIAFEDATVAWPRPEDTDEVGDAQAPPRGAHTMLTDINVKFPPGELSVIAGKTGSGKSLLLAAILGEVKLIAGNIYLPSAPEPSNDENIRDQDWIIPSLTCFVSQTPWIESGTVRDNILFGLPFNRLRYQKVLCACALEKDLQLLADGDQTGVGPKGVSLSGGQRWRIALARALYSRAGIIVMDNILSAVDTHVSRLIVEEALTGGLAVGRTRILATHHVDLVHPYASCVVRLRGGRLRSVGYNAPENQNLTPTTAVFEPGSIPWARPDGNGLASSSSSAMMGLERRQTREEKRAVGWVKWDVYKAYYKASGGALNWALGMAVLFVGHGLGIVRTWSLKELAQRAAFVEANSKMPFTAQYHQTYSQMTLGYAATNPTACTPKFSICFWISTYALVCFLVGVSQIARDVTFTLIGMRASRKLFQQLTHTILRTPIRWIETVPAGRILNRFTSDISVVDKPLATPTFTFIQAAVLLMIIVVTCSSVSLSVLFFVILLFALYVYIANNFIHVAREVKRLKSVSNSPIYDQFSSVLSGLTTIRAFKRTQSYTNNLYQLIDANSSANWSQQLLKRWIGFRMGMLGAVFVTIVAGAVALGGVDAALAGFSLSFAFRYTSALTSLLEALTALELGFNSCERVLEYIEVERESEQGLDAPAAWPAEGRIEVENLTASYARDLQPVLSDLNFSVGAGERVGIVGRTGAGKSTLAAVLFRLLEPSRGSIRIDGLDISTLKLTQLRKSLVIIPQDPFLFSGTLRSNLDTEGRLDDTEIYNALRRVNLIGSIYSNTSYPPSLYTPVMGPRTVEPATAEVNMFDDIQTLGDNGVQITPFILDTNDNNPLDLLTFDRHPEDSTPVTSLPEVEQQPASAPVPKPPSPEGETPSPPPISLPAPLLPLPLSPSLSAITTSTATVNHQVNNPFTNLSHPITTGGSNLSQGQRQLVCLARALLTRPKIMVLDEATSAIDQDTDAAIQRSLRECIESTGTTVLVIAHRLSTVADFDKGLVLDKGRVVEFGSPGELVRRGDSEG
ncbi:unnamed protein product [Sordaria macrospora k-hell]|uniref:WGS project CABT00000000 data, contig 2.58 n=1 Tax=Sordaria macrospora (strain ATCC MYA-333 / DSM 997 / K(L3346) / K-hell) TaxID=771870 RepID=F7WA76_SORMK|nr:uncharacterized protein SMAC_08480 [Sordaria macrospora k-hell]CCC14139.1 unnamed protein product [Sordaria macrospora k-hell]